jgi:hypothetical protein
MGIPPFVAHLRLRLGASQRTVATLVASVVGPREQGGAVDKRAWAVTNEGAEEGLMKRTSVFVAIAFLAGLGTGFFAHSAGVGRLLRRDPHAADLAAIEKLHQILPPQKTTKLVNGPLEFQ